MTTTSTEKSDLEFALALQLEDLRSIQAKSKEKRRSDDPSDSEIASGLYELLLQQCLGEYQDQSLAQSINKAVAEDLVAVKTVLVEETDARRDRLEALRQSGESIAPSDHFSQPEAWLSHNMLAIDSLTSHFTESISIGEASTSSTPQLRRFVAAEHLPMAECISCTESFLQLQMQRTPCGHDYCTRCLRDLFVKATTDESLFPPRCCRNMIPVDQAARHLSREQLKAFDESAIEFNTTDRVYCSQKECARFIAPRDLVASVATCQKCHTRTCIHCKAEMHLGDCPIDEDTELTLQIAQEQGWRRCYNCHAVVEMNKGCNHITCRCRAQFCYECGTKWKECHCLMWQEERLLYHAQAIQDRERNRGPTYEQGQPPNPANHAPVLSRSLSQIRQIIIDNHECVHAQGWQKEEGVEMCDICGFLCKNYIMTCPDCTMMACKRCAINRV